MTQTQIGMGMATDQMLEREADARRRVTDAERARREQEQRLQAILFDAENAYLNTFLPREAPRSASYPDHQVGWRLIAVTLGPRVALWTEHNVGAPFHWEDVDPRHPDGRVSLEGTLLDDSEDISCAAWPTKRVRQAIRDGWLEYLQQLPSEARETPIVNVTAESIAQVHAARRRQEAREGLATRMFFVKTAEQIKQERLPAQAANAAHAQVNKKEEQKLIERIAAGSLADIQENLEILTRMEQGLPPRTNAEREVRAIAARLIAQDKQRAEQPGGQKKKTSAVTNWRSLLHVGESVQPLRGRPD